MPEALSPGFIIDVTSPDAGISAEYNVFSPNNDSKKDFLIINQKTSSEEIWTGLIKNKEGRIVLEKKWFRSADPVLNGMLSHQAEDVLLTGNIHTSLHPSTEPEIRVFLQL